MTEKQRTKEVHFSCFGGSGDLRVVMLSRMRRGWAGEKVSQAAEIANAKAKVES